MYYHKLQDLVDNLKEILYPLEAPQKARTVPMQVLAVGPLRSGTDSLRAALAKLGYQHVYHGYDIALNPEDDKGWWNVYRKKWRGRGTDQNVSGNNNKPHIPSSPLTAEDFDSVIGHCAAITDLDAAVFAHDLIHAYPDAKVILNVRRDRAAWHRSVQDTILQHLQADWRMWVRSFFCVELFWVEENLLRCLWPAFCRGGDFAHTGRWALEEHCAMVRGSVRDQGRDLLEWDVEDGWEPLCRFLGKPIPDEPFPNGNSSEEFRAKIRDLYASFNRRADKNMAITVGVIGLLLLFLWTLLRVR
ncbi:NAD dependent epimerase/dehydratase [Apiospora rasikravindrae]|uniref:NAD dependent epimerase/dehydratase n=1 Tax=Apiospora rasikravindrae TaxID=990691 RepID=A0ABR1TFI3_9PEZI